jgi:hypothetical protein
MALPRRKTIPQPSEAWRGAVYHPLGPARRQIRILCLYPSTDLRRDPVGHLETTSLEGASFAAISYVWGDQSHQRSMLLSDWRIPIGENAHTALRYLRDPQDAKYFWIDTICINQADVPEKNQQVPLMRDIFGCARHVLLWTGLDETTVWAMEFLEDTRAGVARAQSVDMPYDIMMQQLWSHIPRTPVIKWKCVALFLELPLFHRVWTLQEMLLGAPPEGRDRFSHRRRAFFVTGRRRFDYITLQESLGFIRMAFTRHSGVGDTWGSWDGWNPMPMLMHSTFMNNLFQLWFTTADFNTVITCGLAYHLQATNPKDFVYGLIGLLPYLSCGVDYSKPLGKIYEEATLGLIMHNRSLTHLLIRSDRAQQPPSDMPSWVIDWRQKDVYRFDDRWVAFAENEYTADASRPIPFEISGHSLRVAAHVLFTFEDESSLGPPNEMDDSLLQAPNEQYRFARTKLDLNQSPTANDLAAFRRNFASCLMLDLGIHRNGGSSRLTTDSKEDAINMIAMEILLNRFDQSAGDERIFRQVYGVLSVQLQSTRIAISPTKQLCIVPEATKVGDVVCILAGCGMPIVLRPVASQKSRSYRVVGAAYVHGVMDGEAVIESAKRVSTGDPDAYDSAFNEDLWLV